MRFEDALEEYERAGQLEVGSRYLVPGLNPLFDVMAIREAGDGRLAVVIRDTVSWDCKTKYIAKSREAS